MPLNKKKSPFKGSTLAPRAQEFVFSLCIFFFFFYSLEFLLKQTFKLQQSTRIENSLPWSGSDRRPHGMGEGGLMSLKTEGVSLEAQRGRPGPGAAAVSPPRPPPPGAAGSQPCQRGTLSRCGRLSASGRAVWIQKREGEREACPQCIFLHASPTGHPSKIMTWHSIP